MSAKFPRGGGAGPFLARSLNRLRTDSTLPKPMGGLNAFNWYQLFALYSDTVEVQKILVSPTSLDIILSNK